MVRVSLPGVKTVIAAVPERDARVRRRARAAHRGRRRAARLRAPGRRRGPRAQPVHDAAADDARLREPRRSTCPSGSSAAPLAAERELAEQVGEAIGDGVLLHPPFSRVAPRHGRTVGRPWMLAPMALFNLLGLPVTEVPLGLNEAGSAARRPGRRRARPRPRRDRGRARARARLRRLGTSAAPRTAPGSSGTARALRPAAPPWPLLNGELALHALVACAPIEQ